MFTIMLPAILICAIVCVVLLAIIWNQRHEPKWQIRRGFMIWNESTGKFYGYARNSAWGTIWDNRWDAEKMCDCIYPGQGKRCKVIQVRVVR